MNKKEFQFEFDVPDAGNASEVAETVERVRIMLMHGFAQYGIKSCRVELKIVNVAFNDTIGAKE
jgi:hypothetical protein